jgi:hypothetical protein
MLIMKILEITCIACEAKHQLDGAKITR